MNPAADSPPPPPATMLQASFDNVILLATLPGPALDTPRFLRPAIANAARCARQRLVIVLYSRHFNARRPRAGSGSGVSTLDAGADAPPLCAGPAAHWDTVQSILTFAYVQATCVAQELDRVLLAVDVLLKGLDEELPDDLGANMEIAFRIEGDCIPAPMPASIAALRTTWCASSGLDSLQSTPPVSTSPSDSGRQPSREPQQESNSAESYRVVALGGTFDHLHAGHKILLSMGAYLASAKLIVGVTDDALLGTKKHRSVLEDLRTRIERARAFVKLFAPKIEVQPVPINDVYGPTATEADIQALVVSHETLGGAAAIDKIRAERGLPPLRTFVIDVISHSDARLDPANADALKHAKMSSTFIREWIVRRTEEGVGADEADV